MAYHVDNHKPYLTKQRSSPRSIITSSSKLSTNYFLLVLVILSVLHLRTLIGTARTPFPFSISSYTSWSFSKYVRRNFNPEDAVAFLPLKDLRFEATAMEGNTWFMSAINDTYEKGEAEYLLFPSPASGGRMLCVRGNSTGNGTMNSYGLVPKGALLSNAKVLPGLTFVSDSYYDYRNLFHGLTAVAPFVAWHTRKGCVKPARWVLYRRGEVTHSPSVWVRTILEAVFGGELNVERFGNGNEMSNCFEEAVVFRHNQGSMGKERREAVYDLIRCRARAHCKISDGDGHSGGNKAIRLTLLLRVGARSFKDDEAVIRIFDTECRKVEGCKLKVATPNNLTFCDQVKLMTETDILASPHGAQLTNMFFMDKNSSVMEFFPRGWELAGVGRFVYQWMAGWSRMRHQGTWTDPQGDPCPANVNTAGCFSFYKNQQIGHNETFFAVWAARVLGEVRQQMLESKRTVGSSCSCA